MSQTRRLAAILAADVAGYSRLMGADEEGTLERLKALRRELVDPKIAEHHGRLVKTTGDGLLVEFASIVDAVRCAVEVQQAMPERNTSVAADNRIELRIGINLGDVIVEGDDQLMRLQMREVGAFEAKNRLGALLDQVERGEESSSPARQTRSQAGAGRARLRSRKGSARRRRSASKSSRAPLANQILDLQTTESDAAARLQQQKRGNGGDFRLILLRQPSAGSR
jgi:hypothetical protein